MSNLLLNQDTIGRSVGEAVKRARQAKGWSMADAAEQVSIRKHLYRNIETGRELPDTITLAKLVHRLGVDANQALAAGDWLVDRVRAAGKVERQFVMTALKLADEFKGQGPGELEAAR